MIFFEYCFRRILSMVNLLLAIIYVSFISLGLPDSLLGSAWPSMYEGLNVPVSYAGIISMIISAGTIVSSLQSDRLNRKLGTGKVTAISVGMTAVALMGFSLSDSYWMLCLWAIPYGLGAGSVDAALNNYVALHYASRHMSWLHCMWGVGTSVGPYIMSTALTNGQTWNAGYRYISLFQMVLTAILIFSLPIWKKAFSQESAENIESAASKEASGKKFNAGNKETTASQNKPLTLPQIIAIPGAKEIMLTFFCYCALEATTGLWASSYLVLNSGLTAETAAGFASLYYLGITIGRGASGFITMKLNDVAMVRLGMGIMVLGLAGILLPLGTPITLLGLILLGLGSAPVYPCLIHSTPEHFGAERSQALIGVQMASAYTGTCLMPPLFGLLANHISVSLYPFYLLVLLVLMIVMHEKLQKTF